MPPFLRYAVAALVLVIIAAFAEQYDERIGYLFAIVTLGGLLLLALKKRG